MLLIPASKFSSNVPSVRITCAGVPFQEECGTRSSQVPLLSDPDNTPLEVSTLDLPLDHLSTFSRVASTPLCRFKAPALNPCLVRVDKAFSFIEGHLFSP